MVRLKAENRRTYISVSDDTSVKEMLEEFLLIVSTTMTYVKQECGDEIYQYYKTHMARMLLEDATTKAGEKKKSTEITKYRMDYSAIQEQIEAILENKENKDEELE